MIGLRRRQHRRTLLTRIALGAWFASFCLHGLAFLGSRFLVVNPVGIRDARKESGRCLDASLYDSEAADQDDVSNNLSGGINDASVAVSNVNRCDVCWNPVCGMRWATDQRRHAQIPERPTIIYRNTAKSTYATRLWVGNIVITG